MTYDEALKWYHSFEKFGVVPGLGRVRALCSRLGDPQKKYSCVHVTGTNGKGTVCTETANVLTCAGYKTALYTSPEVLDFRERMQIDGKMIPEDELCAVTEKVRNAVAALNAESVYPTQFEVLTAAAFLWFSEQKCDIAVLETGLGGRFDATNIIDSPLVCAITSVSLDHTAILGDTYIKIAFEKCGIIKKNTSVIVAASVRTDVKKVVLETAEANDADVCFADEKQCFSFVCDDITGSEVIYRGRSMKIPFLGLHQIQNAAVTVNICRRLIEKGLSITDENIVRGIGQARIPARTEILSATPLIILDGSHNDASTAALAQVLKKYLPAKKILAVMGMMADKDCKTSFCNLASCFSRVIAVKPSNPRSMEAERFAALASQCGVESVAAGEPEKGIDEAFAELDDFDALVVCGSLYLSADVRDYLMKKIKNLSESGG